MRSVNSICHFDEFRRWRDASFQATSLPAEQGKANSIESPDPVNFQSLPTDFKNVLDKVWNDLRILSYGISHLATLQKRQRDFQFRSVQEEDKESKEVYTWTKKMSIMLSTFQKHLRLLDSTINHLPRNPKRSISSAKLRICRNLKLHVTLKVEDLRAKFEKNQFSHMEFVNQRKEKQGKKIEKPEMHSPSRDVDSSAAVGPRESMSEHMIETYLERGLNMAEMNLLIEHEHITNQRELEMKAVTRAINDLNDLFCDVHVFVVTQGTILDHIQYNLQNVHQRIESGVEDLSKAIKYQGQKVYKWVFLVLVILIIAFLFTTLTRIRAK